MLKGIIKGVNAVTRFSAMLAGFLLVALMLLNTYAVICRYGFNRPVDWILDLSEFLMVASVFLGAAYILQIDGHVTVDLIVIKLPARVRRILFQVTMCFVFVFNFVLTWKSWELAWDNLYARSDSISRFPLFPGYIIVFYGSLLLLLQSLIKLYVNLKGKEEI